MRSDGWKMPLCDRKIGASETQTACPTADKRKEMVG